MYKIGDYVTRNKYGNDIVFKIISIEKDVVKLSGVDIRLVADSNINDLTKTEYVDKEIPIVRSKPKNDMFYIPGIILHMDSDEDYINKCKKYYESKNLKVYYHLDKESNYKNVIIDLINKYKPNIVVITGHDAHYNRPKDGKIYKNSEYFIETINMIRDKKIIVFAGACQSDYESLIKSGSTYASSPKRVNIHALDPAIIASSIALTNNNALVDAKEVINKTHFKENGIGGLYVNGTMLTGYPRGKI